MTTERSDESSAPWKCDHWMHDTNRCTPTKHVGPANSGGVASVRTYTRILFADPNLTCTTCGETAEGYRQETLALLPCGHHSAALSGCPSWGPIDGCRCLGHPHLDRATSPALEADRG